MDAVKVPQPKPASEPGKVKKRSGPRSRSSPYKGVTQYRRTGKWEAHIWIPNPRGRGYQRHLGSYDTAEEAARCFDRATIRVRGSQEELNFPLEEYSQDPFMVEHGKTEKFKFLDLMRARFAIISENPAVRKPGQAQHAKAVAGPSTATKLRPLPRLAPMQRSASRIIALPREDAASRMAARKLSKHASHAEDDYTAALLQTPPLFYLDQPLWMPPSANVATPKVSPAVGTAPGSGLGIVGTGHTGELFTSPQPSASALSHGTWAASPGRNSTTGTLPGTVTAPPLFQTAAAAAQAVQDMFPLPGFSSAPGASPLELPGHDELMHGINMFSDPHDGLDFKDWLCGSPYELPNFLSTTPK